MIQIQSRSMSDPTFSDIDFKIKMASMWTTLKFYDIIYMINLVGQRVEKTQKKKVSEMKICPFRHGNG